MNKVNFTPIQKLLTQPITNHWLVDGYIERKSLNMLFGEPGTCKSFLAMELALCVSAGLDWYGRPVQKGHVVYIAGEGKSGIQKRFLALQDKYKHLIQDIVISDSPAELTNEDCVQQLLSDLQNYKQQPSLIIIDTMHRNFGTGDENSSKDIGIFIKHLDQLKNNTDAAI
ncbi:MAG: AAA family ATPase [Alteromonadaceae bacterium]|nr:AAA family ATPase [Alteromonadaceae bacterium]